MTCYGVAKQFEAKQRDWFNFYDHAPATMDEQNDVYSFIFFSVLASITTVVHCSVLVVVAAKKSSANHRNIGDVGNPFKLCLVLSSMSSATAEIGMEIASICSLTRDWNMLIYTVLSTGAKLMEIICQGIIIHHIIIL